MARLPSIPGVRADVTRVAPLRSVLATSMEKPNPDSQGLLAVCIQHEMDHLEGKMYFDRLGQFERQAVLNAYRDYFESDDQRPLTTALKIIFMGTPSSHRRAYKL